MGASPLPELLTQALVNRHSRRVSRVIPCCLSAMRRSVPATHKPGEGAAPYSPAERPEPGQVIRVVHVIANRDDLMETFDLDTHHLHKKTSQSCNICWLNISSLQEIKNMHAQSKRCFSSCHQPGRSLLTQHGKLVTFFPPFPPQEASNNPLY